MFKLPHARELVDNQRQEYSVLFFFDNHHTVGNRSKVFATTLLFFHHSPAQLGHLCLVLEGKQKA